MSEAILVIDTLMVDNKYICCDEQQSCPLWNKDKWCCEYKRNTGIKGCPLKPLPKKRGDITLTERTQNIDMVKWQLENKLTAKGWNDCIDKIIGKEE